jgi:hypothetical protein
MVVLCCTEVSIFPMRLGFRKLTLSHASIPLLVFFPPFCISLSFPTDTALNAKN